VNILLAMVAIQTIMIGTCAAQTLRPHIRRLSDSIARTNVLDGSVVGIAGGSTGQWKRYERLKAEASTNELTALVAHKNAVVKCYAFRALTYRKDADVFSILCRQLYDNAFLSTHYGCISSREYVGDYMLGVVTSAKPDTGRYRLGDREQAIIDSILITGGTAIWLEAQSKALVRHVPDPRWYDRIREIVKNVGIPSALVALATYRHPQDREIIVKGLQASSHISRYYALWAVRIFPDTMFFPYLVRMYASEAHNRVDRWNLVPRMLYQAIVQYRNSASRDILVSMLEKRNSVAYEDHAKCIWLALKRYRSPIYEGLDSMIVLDDRQESDLEYTLQHPDDWVGVW